MTMRMELPYLSAEVDRHGNPRLYVRFGGRRIRIREKRGTAAFAAAYAAAVETLARPSPQKGTPVSGPVAGTLDWLAAKYFASDEFQAIDPQSQANRRGVIEACLVESFKDSDPEPIGHCPVKDFCAADVKRLRDLKARQGLLGAANNRRKYLSSMFGWAIEAGIGDVKSNPCRDVRRKKYPTAGFYTWQRSDIRQFSERHPIGTKAMLALGLFLFLGVRKSDMVRLGPKMLREIIMPDGTIARSIRFQVRKTRHVRAVESEKPILPVLWDIIQASPCGTETFLETEYGKPFTAKGVGNWMRNRCDEAGLPQCTSHGVRKISATMVAEGGASEHQLMSIFDWATPTQAATYTREANRRRMAQDSMHLLAAPFSFNAETGGLH